MFTPMPCPKFGSEWIISVPNLIVLFSVTLEPAQPWTAQIDVSSPSTEGWWCPGKSFLLHRDWTWRADQSPSLKQQPLSRQIEHRGPNRRLVRREAPQSPAKAGAWLCLWERIFQQAVQHSESVSSPNNLVSFPKCHTRSKAFLKPGYVSFVTASSSTHPVSSAKRGILCVTNPCWLFCHLVICQVLQQI